MNRESNDLLKYCEDHIGPGSSLLDQIERDTHLNTLAPQMLSGLLQGRLLSLISHLLKPQVILEVGSFTGYATLCLAEGLSPTGKIITIESNAELKHHLDKNFAASNVHAKITLHIGQALNIIPTIKEQLDLVFLDASKEEYIQYYEMVIPKMKIGAVIIADNVLWSGKVLEEKKDKKTQTLHQFNQLVANDDRVESFILPFNDGLHMIRKVKN